MLPSIDYVPLGTVHPDDLRAVVAETAPGATYEFTVLYGCYEAKAFANDRQPSSPNAFGRALGKLGWRKSRVQHGTVRVWTRPSDAQVLAKALGPKP